RVRTAAHIDWSRSRSHLTHLAGSVDFSGWRRSFLSSGWWRRRDCRSARTHADLTGNIRIKRRNLRCVGAAARWQIQPDQCAGRQQRNRLAAGVAHDHTEAEARCAAAHREGDGRGRVRLETEYLWRLARCNRHIQRGIAQAGSGDRLLPAETEEKVAVDAADTA